MLASALMINTAYGTLIFIIDYAVHPHIEHCSSPRTDGIYYCKFAIVFYLAFWSRHRASGMESRAKPSLGRVSSQTDWEVSVGAEHCTRSLPIRSFTAGALVAGPLSDIVVKRWREKRRGVWCPEDRLRATWIGGLIMVPLSIGASGLITT